MSDVYERLRARLDDLAVGLPETESKIEINLLKRMFTEPEAEFFVQLQPLLEAAQLIEDGEQDFEQAADQARRRIAAMKRSLTPESQSSTCARIVSGSGHAMA